MLEMVVKLVMTDPELVLEPVGPTGLEVVPLV